MEHRIDILIMLSYENETMDSFGFTQEEKDSTAKHKKKEFKRIKKQIKKARKNGDRHYVLDDVISLSVLLKLDDAGFYVKSVLIPKVTRQEMYATGPRAMTAAWVIFW